MEQLPWFYALLLSATANREPGACCIVLDKTEGTAALAAILVALNQLQKDFPLLAEDYAANALTVGERVRVKPYNLVYEYGGVWDRHPGKFELKVLDETGRRSFPITQVVRLEPTARKRPKGTLISDVRATERVGIDELLNITTFGNTSISRNVVLLYMARARFKVIAESVSLGSSAVTELDRVSDLLSHGSVGPNGEVIANDAYQLVGEPYIAVSRVPQDLAAAAIDAPVASKVVLVDGARGITGDLQSLDDMSERQRVVILASPDETEDIRILRERDCAVWYMSENEVDFGEPDGLVRSMRSVVGRTVRAAQIRKSNQVHIVDCEDTTLETVANALEKIASNVDGSEEQSEAQELLAKLYGVLLGFSECCFGIDEQIEANLKQADDFLLSNQNWISVENVNEFRLAIDMLEDIGNRGILLNGKADALVNAIIEGDGKWAVATRLPRTAEMLRAGLDGLGDEIPVYAIRDIPSHQEWDGFILPAWPNGHRFKQLINYANAREIRILTFSFERRWVLSHQKRERAFKRSNRINNSDRATILGIPDDLLERLHPNPNEPVVEDIATDPPMIKFERQYSGRRAYRPAPGVTGQETRRARLIEFTGGSCALVTEWHKLNVLNELVDIGNGKSNALRLITAEHLARGDYVIFRADGDKEFIRLLAEDHFGVEEYSEKRALADRWRSALRSLGFTASVVQDKLEKFGLYRTLPTISGWLWDLDRIGPRDDRDVEIIGKAAGDTDLLANLVAVHEAISQIRGGHISAGNRLTELILDEVEGQLTQFDGRPILLDLGFGRAWVVEVLTIESRLQHYAVDQVNRLLNAETTPF